MVLIQDHKYFQMVTRYLKLIGAARCMLDNLNDAGDTTDDKGNEYSIVTDFREALEHSENNDGYEFNKL